MSLAYFDTRVQAGTKRRTGAAIGVSALESHPLPSLIRLTDRVHANDDSSVLVALVQHYLTCRQET